MSTPLNPLLQSGLTLRDAFAIQIIGYLAQKFSGDLEDGDEALLADDAYAIADAMLERRLEVPNLEEEQK